MFLCVERFLLVSEDGKLNHDAIESATCGRIQNESYVLHNTKMLSGARMILHKKVNIDKPPILLQLSKLIIF